ncbi:MAG: hypothetical protein Q7S02_05725 [bacterium]|nr:hypothetical protein [bacterium]
MGGRVQHQGATVRVLGVVRARVSHAIDIVRAAIRSGGGEADVTIPGRALARMPDDTPVAIHVRTVDPVARRAELRAFYEREGHPIPDHLKEESDGKTE